MRCSILAIVAIFSLQGCAKAPQVITNITGSGDQMKFIYQGGGYVGLIQCDQLPDGTLSNCTKMPVIFDDNKGGDK